MTWTPEEDDLGEESEDFIIQSYLPGTLEKHKGSWPPIEWHQQVGSICIMTSLAKLVLSYDSQPLFRDRVKTGNLNTPIFFFSEQKATQI